MRCSRRFLVLASSVLVLAGCTTATQGSPPRVDPSATAAGTGTASGTSSAAGTTLVPDRLPRSRPPRVPYVSGRVLHRPDGSALRLDIGKRPGVGVTSIVPAGDGYLMTDDGWFEGTVGMRRLDARGRLVDAWSSTGPARLGPDGQVAWTSVPVPEGMQAFQPRLHVDGRVQELLGHIQPTILQYDGALVVYSARVVLRGRARPRTFQTAVPGRPRPMATPQQRLLAPDRRHWWQRTRGGLEVGLGEAVLVRIPYSSLPGSASEPVWEDARHLLVTLRRDDRQTLLRVGVDGSVSRATPWVPATVAGHAVLAGTSLPSRGDD